MLQEHEFDTLIDKAERPVIVDFTADCCSSCRAIAPVFEKLAEKYEGKAIFAKINTDCAPNLIKRFDMLTVPQFLVLSNGKLYGRVYGPKPKELEALINKAVDSP
jgi:thioredoxin 1